MPSQTRRQVLATLGASSIALAGCLSQGPPSGDLETVGGTWRMVGRNAGHTRQITASPTNPNPVWRTTLEQARATGTPALADTRLYVPVDAVSDTARHRYRLYALTATTGDKHWQVPLRAEPNGPPAVSGSRIIVTAQRALEQGRILCVRAQDGAEEWLVDVDARLTAPPTIARGLVYVPDWRGRVHALSTADGAVRWSRHVDAATGGRTFTTPAAVHDGTLYLGSSAGETGVVALDAITGEEQWRESTPAVTGGPVVHPQGIVVQSHQLVMGFDSDGTRQWSFNIREGQTKPIAVDAQHVYVAARNTVYAIDWSGAEAWRYEAGETRVGSPVVAGDTVLVRSGAQLVGLARTTGETRWMTTLQGGGRPIVTPEAAFVPGGEGTVTALGTA